MSTPGLHVFIRKNPIKSVLSLSAAFGSIAWYRDYTLTHDVMRGCSAAAAAKGDDKLRRATDPVKHVTVILNPVAGKRRSKKLYNKWVEPIFNLAGFKVSLVETESLGQAADVMRIMANCDCVAIVGGDGTVNEVINGLLARPDQASATKKLPIAIIPTGQINSIARYLHQNLTYRNQKEFIIGAAMLLVDGNTRPFDVLKISSTTIDESKQQIITGTSTTTTKLQNATEQILINKPLYALRDVRYGKYQDNYVKVSGFLFFEQYIKPSWLRLKLSLFSNDYSWPKIASLWYTQPCIGCSKCYKKHLLVDSEKKTNPTTNKRWWSIIAPVKSPAETQQSIEEKELAKRTNEDCDTWKQVANVVKISDLRACMMDRRKIRLSVSRRGEYAPSEIVEAQDVKLVMKPEIDAQVAAKSKQVSSLLPLDSIQDTCKKEDETLKEKPQAEVKVAKKNDEKEDEYEGVKFLVDGQPMHAQSIHVTTISKAVNVFTAV